MSDSECSIIYLSILGMSTQILARIFFSCARKTKSTKKIILCFRWPHLEVAHELICSFKIRVQVYDASGNLYIVKQRRSFESKSIYETVCRHIHAQTKRSTALKFRTGIFREEDFWEVPGTIFFFSNNFLMIFFSDICASCSFISW